MTKTLTEQWREGTLPQGNYYIVIRGITEKQKMIDYYIPELHHFEIKPSECILEVLAPVPSYEEWQSCEKCVDMLIDVNKKWEKTIKEIKRLQEQKQKVIALIKDGRFVEALQLLEGK